jgi:hypothetical protein
MPAIQTHSSRGHLLAAALWSSAYALLGCTDGIAEPFSVSGAGAQSSAGHGAAGHGSAGHGATFQLTAGNHGAADGGDGHSDAGNGGPAKTQCDGVPPWTEANAQEEDGLLDLLNTSIEGHKKCADRGTFTRMQFPMMDEALHCSSRQSAFLYAAGATWGSRPPGPGHDPFDPATPPLPLMAMGSTASSARMDLLSDSMDCGALMSPKYTRVGIGYTSGVWVITLAAE